MPSSRQPRQVAAGISTSLSTAGGDRGRLPGDARGGRPRGRRRRRAGPASASPGRKSRGSRAARRSGGTPAALRAKPSRQARISGLRAIEPIESGPARRAGDRSGAARQPATGPGRLSTMKITMPRDQKPGLAVERARGAEADVDVGPDGALKDRGEGRRVEAEPGAERQRERADRENRADQRRRQRHHPQARQHRGRAGQEQERREQHVINQALGGRPERMAWKAAPRAGPDRARSGERPAPAHRRSSASAPDRRLTWRWMAEPG